MPTRDAPRLRHYGIALVTVAVAILLRFLLTPLMGTAFPLATAFSAVAFSSWYSGWRPALLTAVGAFVASDFFFIPGTTRLFGRPVVPEVFSVAVYLLTCGSVIVLGEAGRRAQRRLEAEQRSLAAANLELEQKVEAHAALARERRRNEDEQRLLVAIHDATRGLADPGEVMLQTVALVGAHFGVSRCAYGEVDLEGGTVLITRGFTRDVPTVAGRHPLGAFGAPLIAELRSGHTVVIDDVRRSPFTASPTALPTYERMQIVAMVCVPLIRSGQLVAILVMSDGTPRAWAPRDAARLEHIAERTLFAVESARAAATLRESRDVLALAMGAGQMGAWSRDVATGEVWWSPELEAIVGLPPDGFKGSEAAFFALVHPDDRPAVEQAINAALESRSDYRVEFRFRHASGAWRWMEGRGRAVYSAEGAPRMLYGLGIDITERRAAVEALHEADRRKDEFLATLAHELRNPLAPITAGLHVLRLTGGTGENAATARAAIERQVRQMVRLVDDLLDVARISTGKTELQCAPMDLADAVRDAVDTSRPLMAAAEQPLELVLPAAPVFVHADRTRLAQVFANLLNNSAKYSAPRGPIALTVTRDGDDAVVRVTDTGIGIAAATLPAVFEMFHQADGRGRRSQGGLGIGLFLVKRIVEMHGGSVAAHSDGPGRGSEFVVRIPAVTAPAVTAGTPAPSTVPTAPARRRILVVDDNTDAAELLAMMLAEAGHDTRLAHDGAQALAVAADYRPDVVFLDIGMPQLDGLETAKRIRELPWGQHVLLVAVTGWGQSDDRRRSKEAGFDHHLVKPADPEAITSLIAALEATGTTP